MYFLPDLSHICNLQPRLHTHSRISLPLPLSFLNSRANSARDPSSPDTSVMPITDFANLCNMSATTCVDYGNLGKRHTIPISISFVSAVSEWSRFRVNTHSLLGCFLCEPSYPSKSKEKNCSCSCSLTLHLIQPFPRTSHLSISHSPFASRELAQRFCA